MTSWKLSPSSKYVYSAIREDDDLADELRRAGKNVVKLSSGDPPVYFPTPKHVVDAYVEALRAGKTWYSRSQGIRELVNAIVDRYGARYGIGLEEKDVVVTSGVAEALTFLNSALIGVDDTGVIFKPYYTQYPVAIRMFGGKIVQGRYDEDDGWDLDLDGLARILKGRRRKPKYMLITNPNNPTGTVLPKQALEEIVEIANESRILLISDEIYDEIVFDGSSMVSVGELAKGVPHVILNGASKAYDATGFRLGYALVPGHDALSEALKHKLADYCRVRLSANTPAQYALASAMSDRVEHEKAVGEMVRAIQRSIESAMRLLSENPYLTAVRPRGAFYIFPRIEMRSLRFRDDKEFVESLLREKYVQTTRGSGFGAPDHFRIVSLAPSSIISECMTRINDFCSNHSR